MPALKPKEKPIIFSLLAISIAIVAFGCYFLFARTLGFVKHQNKYFRDYNLYLIEAQPWGGVISENIFNLDNFSLVESLSSRATVWQSQSWYDLVSQTVVELA